MGDVIDRWRLNLGWRPLDNDSQDMAILSWVKVLDAERVPPSCYHTLFERALKLRALALSQNKNVPDFGVELLLACWMGEHGLASELEKKRIEEKRFLPAVAESVCPKCFGSGWARERDEDGRQVLRRCQH